MGSKRNFGGEINEYIKLIFEKISVFLFIYLSHTLSLLLSLLLLLLSLSLSYLGGGKGVPEAIASKSDVNVLIVIEI
jgi:hypothetical protein